MLGRVSKRHSSSKCHLNNSGGAAAQAMCWSDKHVLWKWDVKSTGTGPLIHGAELLDLVVVIRVKFFFELIA